MIAPLLETQHPCADKPPVLRRQCGETKPADMFYQVRIGTAFLPLPAGPYTSQGRIPVSQVAARSETLY